MVHDDFDSKFDRFTRGIIRRKIKQLIGRAGFTRQDVQDLEQDFYLRVLQSLSHFRPSQGHRNAFITAVVERYVANVLRNKRAEKRDHRRISSLNVTIELTDDGHVELSQTIGSRELDARLGRERRSDEELVQLAIDLADLTATLPVEWQALLRHRRSHSLAEVARMLGVPRTTLNEWMRHIRQRFEKADMREYL